MYVVYSKQSCVFCKRAKDLLDILGEDYVEIDVTVGDNLQQLNERLGYAARTVPQIWHGDSHVGGFTELSAYTK